MVQKEFKKLKEIVAFCRTKVPYYRNLLAHFELKTPTDFERIPILTNKIYLENTPPKNFNLLSGKPSRCFVFSSGGTTTNPRYILRDFKDFEDQDKDYAGLEVGENDTIINLFMPGIWGIFSSANLSLIKLGCKIIPCGGSNLTKAKKAQIVSLIEAFGANVLLGVPSTIISLADFLRTKKKTREKITKIFCLGEKIHDSTLDYLENTFPNAVIKLKYGCMETAGIGYQCKYLSKNEYHIFPTHFVEIIDLENKQRVPDGKEGYILVTTLKKRLVPLLRYQTNDIGRIIRKKCQCGKEKILQVLGRNQDTLITASVHLTVDSLEKVIANFEQCSSVFQLVITKRGHLDYIKVLIETKTKKVASKKALAEKILQKWSEEIPDISEAIKSKKIGGIKIILVHFGTIKRIPSTGKIKRIIDLRK